jgi:hypothetical protein
LRAGLSCPSIFGKDCLYFFVRRDLTACYGRKRLIDRLKFLWRRLIDTVPSRLDFQGKLREFILIVLGPTLDAGQYVFHIRVHALYLAPHPFLCTVHWGRHFGRSCAALAAAKKMEHELLQVSLRGSVNSSKRCITAKPPRSRVRCEPTLPAALN